MRGLWGMLWTWVCSFGRGIPEVDSLEEPFDESYL